MPPKPFNAPKAKSKLVWQLGQELQRCRKLSGISQEKLAELVGTAKNYIGEIERGEKEPSITLLYRITHIIGIPLSELIAGAYENKTSLVRNHALGEDKET